MAALIPAIAAALRSFVVTLPMVPYPTNSMDDWSWLWPVLFSALPLVMYWLGKREERMRFTAWKREAQRLGLEAGGSGSEPVVRGTWRGLEIELSHGIHHHYKAAPTWTFVARARIPAADAQPTLELDGPVLAGSASGGFWEHLGDGLLPRERLEGTLDQLVGAAWRTYTSR